MPGDNPMDRYFYRLIVFTGHRLNSGTKSTVKQNNKNKNVNFYFLQVSFNLNGDDDETGIRTFSHSDRKFFQRSGIDVFILACPKYVSDDGLDCFSVLI